MDQDMKSARVNPGVAPGSGVYLGLEQGEIEALHVALAAGVAQRLEIPAVPHLVLVRRFLRQVLAAASRRSQRHPRAKLFLGSLAFPFSLSLSKSFAGRENFLRFWKILLARRGAIHRGRRLSLLAGFRFGN